MKYIAAQSAGVTKDYTWQKSIEDTSDTHLRLRDVIDDTVPSIAVCREGEQWHCLIGGISSLSTDYRGRTNRLTIIFCGLSKDEARRLVISILHDWNGSVHELLEAFTWEKSKSEIEWTVNFLSLENSFRALVARSLQTPIGIPFNDAWERRNTPVDWRKVTEEIEKHSFTETDGVKFVVTGAPSQESYNLMIEQADRVLWSGDDERELTKFRNKKKEKKQSPTQSGKSTWLSTTSSGQFENYSTDWAAWIKSNGIFMIAFAIAALLLLEFFQCQKKK